VNKVPGIWKWTVGILFILNLALLATIWCRPGAEHSMPPPMHEGARPDELIKGKLHFTEEQNKAFDELRDRHHDSIMMLQRQGKALRTQYFDYLKHPGAADSNRIDSLGAAIGNVQQQIEFVTFRHFRQVRMLCDEKQKATFDEIIDDVLRMMARQHGSKKENEDNHGPLDRAEHDERKGGGPDEGQGPPRP